MNEFIYDGKLAEKRLSVLEKLRAISTDRSLYERISVAQNRLALKHEYAEFLTENDVYSYVYFDVYLNGYVYDVVLVGKYGMAIVGETNNSIFDSLEEVYVLEEPVDILRLKPSILFSRAKKYREFVLNGMGVCPVWDLVGGMVHIDLTAFINSELWKNLDTRRLLLAEHYNTVPHLIFRVRDVVELLNLAPENPMLTVNIDSEYQKIILNEWHNYLQ